jgi:hypothetical protein
MLDIIICAFVVYEPNEKTENEACIEVAASEKVPVETIRTQVKKCKADPYYEYYAEEWVWGWFDDEEYGK